MRYLFLTIAVLLCLALSVSAQADTPIFTELLRIERIPASERYADRFSFDPSGQRLAASNLDTTVTIWDVQTGAARFNYRGHAAYVGHVAFSPDGTLIASSGDDAAHIWDAATGTLVQAFPRTGAVEWSPDGTYLALGRYDRNKETWLEVRTLSSEEPIMRGDSWGGIGDIAWSPDGLLIAAANGLESSYLHVWNLAGERIETFWSGDDIAWGPDNHLLASATQIRNIETGLPEVVIPDLLGAIDWHPDGHWLASGSARRIDIWDAHSGALVTSIPVDCAQIRGITWSQTRLAAACIQADPEPSNTIILWGWS